MISLSLMPMMVLKDFIQLSKWQVSTSNSILGSEWVFSVPDDANLDFIHINGRYPFHIDRKSSIIYFVVINLHNSLA